MTKNFNQLYKKLLLEMPQQINTHLKMNTDTNHIKQSYKRLADIHLNNNEWEMYSMGNGKDFDISLIKDDQVMLEAAYELFGKGIKSSYIQQEKHQRGLARAFYTQYLITQYDFIMSDNTMTPQGFGFWKKLFNQYKNNYLFSIFDKQNNKLIKIKNDTQMEEVFGKDASNHYYSFVMQKI